MNQLKLNINLSRLESFMNNNELSVNVTKTSIVECMIQQKRGKIRGDPPHLIVQDPEKPTETIRISDKNKFRILGANISQNMSWQAHLVSEHKAIFPAVRKKLGALKQLGAQLPKHSRRALAEGLLLSKMQYLITLWGGATNNLMTQAQTLQNQIARWVTKSGKRTKITTLMSKCNWLTVRKQAKYHAVIQLWKIIRMNIPEAMTEHFDLDDDNYITTNTPRLQFTKLGFRWRSTETLNKLPSDMREIRSLPTTKRRLKTWIKERRSSEPD